MSNWKAPPGWRKLRERVFAIHGRTCYRCGAFADSVDHITPVALGGGHELSNLRPACKRCNSSTGASMGNRLSPRTPPARMRAWIAAGKPPPRPSRRW